MKKWIVIFLVAIFMGSAAASYEPTDLDLGLLVKMQKKLGKMYEQKPERLAKIKTRIDNIGLNEDTQLGYLLSKIGVMIDEIFNENGESLSGLLEELDEQRYVGSSSARIEGQCGSVGGSTVGFLHAGSANLCHRGRVVSFLSINEKDVSWRCEGTNGGRSVSCNAKIARKADMVIDGIRLQTGGSDSGTIIYEVKIRNKGYATSPETHLQFAEEGGADYFLPVPSLEPQESVSFDFEFPVRADLTERTFVAKVDLFDNTVDEIDNTNNTLTRTFTVSDKPLDYYFGNEVETQDFSQRQAFKVTICHTGQFSVQNLSEQTSLFEYSKGLPYTYRLTTSNGSQQPVKSFFSGFAAHVKNGCTLAEVLVRGENASDLSNVTTVEVFIDPDNILTETNEGNNQLTIQVN